MPGTSSTVLTAETCLGGQGAWVSGDKILGAVNFRYYFNIILWYFAHSADKKSYKVYNKIVAVSCTTYPPNCPIK